MGPTDRATLIRTALQLGHEHDASEDRVIEVLADAILNGRRPEARPWQRLRREHDALEYRLLTVYARLKLCDPAALEAIRNGEEPPL